MDAPTINRGAVINNPYQESVTYSDEDNKKRGNVAIIPENKVDKKLTVEKFHQGKILGKMLLIYGDGKLFKERFVEELDELTHQGVIRASSTSLLVAGKPCDLFRHIGLLLDSEKCQIRYVSTCDARICRITDIGERVKWDSSIKKYTKYFSEEREVVNFCGKFTARGKRLDNIEELLKNSQSKPKGMFCEGRLLEMNEVVVDWDKDSIVGIVCTKYVHVMSDQKLVCESRLKSDSLILQAELKKQTLVSCPVFLYDHLKGNLHPLDDT